MSDDIRDEKKLRGLYLTQEARSDLEGLSVSLEFLRRLAMPRTAGDGVPSLDWQQLSCGLELLAERVEHLLGDPSDAAPLAAQVDAREAACDASAPSREHHDADDEPLSETGDPLQSECVVFGVTLDQFDTLDRLIQSISAHGDVVSASSMADFASHTLPMMGYAIFDGATAVRGILGEVEVQRLPLAGSRFRVRETRASYATGHLPADHRSGLVWLRYWPKQHTGQDEGARLH